MFISSNHASFYLWRKENLVKHQKASKYYENDFRSSLQKMKVMHCKIVSVIAGATGGSSKEKLYQHLGLKTLQQRQ